MCIPHGATGSKDSGYIEDGKPRKKVEKLPKAIFENGDPNYDGVVIEYKKPEPKKGFLQKVFGL